MSKLLCLGVELTFRQIQTIVCSFTIYLKTKKSELFIGSLFFINSRTLTQHLLSGDLGMGRGSRVEGKY